MICFSSNFKTKKRFKGWMNLFYLLIIVYEKIYC